MSFWTAIALIVIAGVVGEAWRNHVKTRQSGITKDALKELNDKMDTLDSELRDRIETLERIVTDRQENLKRQFDHLDKAG